MRRTATGLVLTAGLSVSVAAMAEAHVLPLGNATTLAKKLEAKQRTIRRGVTHQTLTKGRRVSDHRVVFHYTDSNRAGTFGCQADLVAKFVSRTGRRAIAFFTHRQCGVPD
jgi:hypothetical protein